MSIGNKLSMVMLTAALGGLIVPAFAQDHNGTRGTPDQGMTMDHMGRGMMRGGMMSRGMMAGGCAEMMHSMNNSGDGRPNSQWQKHQSPNPDSGG
jgi:hypothetical protein